MLDWLFMNFVFALIVPLLLVFMLAWVVLGTGRLRLIRIARDFQVCLYCAALIGATKYDVGVAIRTAPEDRLRAITDGAGTIDFAMTAVLLIAAFFYGASVCLAYLSGDDQPAHERDKLIVVASACTVGMTLLFVIMARTQAGLL